MPHPEERVVAGRPVPSGELIWHRKGAQLTFLQTLRIRDRAISDRPTRM
jgi:hypothetical protein